jgi:hypothetical protein
MYTITTSLTLQLKLEANIQTFSLSVSSADVASSNKSILGLRIKARAMAILCFCPPDINVPLSPTKVSYPYQNYLYNLKKSICRHMDTGTHPFFFIVRIDHK